MSDVQRVEEVSTKLKNKCMSFIEVLAESISTIGPSIAPALGIPAVFATAGNQTWATYLFAMIVVLLVCYSVNHFARRSASPGSFYGYISEGFGPTAGVISGWGLIMSYVLTGGATLSGFANYTNVALSPLGIRIPTLLLFLGGVIVVWLITYKGIELSAKLMIALEAVSISMLLILGVTVLIKNGFTFDTRQIDFSGISYNTLKIGLVLAFFSFVGFESATSLGFESKKPSKYIPRAVTLSALFVGVFFTFFSYTEILGFLGSSVALDGIDAPLNYLADQNGIGFMGILISIGAAFSCFACTVACTIAGSRIVYSFAKHKIISSSLARTHKVHNTPFIATTIISVVLFCAPAYAYLIGGSFIDIYGWLGTIATFGFLFNYTAIIIAAPIYLYKRKELRTKHVIGSLIGLVAISIPVIGSIYPAPEYPFDIFPYIFLGWILLGGIWFKIASSRRSEIKDNIAKGIELAREQVLSDE